MDGKTRKIILIGFALVALVALAIVCSDVFLVIAIMSVLTNLLVFAELGHKFWSEIFDDDEPIDDNLENKEPGSSDGTIDNSSVSSRVDAIISDTAADTYLPYRNTGHIGYYEDPLLEPDEMFPKYYGDVDNATVAYEKRRIREQQSVDGYVNKGSDHYKAYYRSEFADQENAGGWWGNMDI